MRVQTTGGVGSTPPVEGGTTIVGRFGEWSTEAVLPITYRLRAWAAARRRTVAVLALVVAATTTVALTLAAGTVRTSTAPERYERSWGPGHDAAVTQEQGRPRIDEVEALPSVESVEMATFVFGGLGSPDGTTSYDTFVFAGTRAPLVQRLLEGRDPAPDRPDELEISQSLADAGGLHLGDHVQLVTLTTGQAETEGFDAEHPAGLKIRGTVVGIMGGPGELSGDGGALALFPPSLLDAGDVGFATSVGSADLRPGAGLRDLRRELDGLPEASVFQVDPTEIVPSDAREAVSTQARGLAVLSLVVGLSTLVVVSQLLSRQLRFDEREREVLRALGFTRGQLLAEQSVRAAVVAGLGALLAVGGSFLASTIFPIGYAHDVEPFPGRRFDVLVLVVGAVAVTVVLLALVVVAGAAERRALAAPGDRLPLVERLVPSLPNARMTTALRFAFTSRARSGQLPLMGITLVSVVLFGALAFGANLTRLITDPASYGYDFDLSLGQGGDAVPKQLVTDLSNSHDVEALTLLGLTSLRIGTDSLDVVGGQPVVGDLGPQLLQGHLPSGDDEIALGPVAARRLGRGIGDRVSGTAPTGKRSLTVTGIALIPSVGGADQLGRIAYVTEGGFRALDADTDFSEAGIRLVHRSDPEAKARVMAITGPAGIPTPPAEIASLDRVRTIPWIVAGAVGLLVVLSLGHLMLVAVGRRRRDFAVLRAMGAPRGWLTSVVHWQATAIATVVLGISVPLGSLAGTSLYRRYVDHLGARPSSILPLGRVSLVLGALLGLANVVAALAARRVHRDAVSATLAAG